MPNPTIDDLTALDLVSERLIAAIGRIGEDQWAVTTPCDEWDVTALVDHLAGGNWFTLAVLAGWSADEAMAEARASFGGGHADGRRAMDSVDDQRAAFATPGALAGDCDHVKGRLPIRQVLRLRLHDLIVHTWDLEQGLRPPAEIPATLVQWGLEELEAPGSLLAPDLQPTASDRNPGAATPQRRYLERFGRR